MKLVIRAVVFHIFCIIVFAFTYSNFSEQFHFMDEDKKSLLNFFLLSTTIQSGLGITLYPLSYYTKILVMIQQMLMIFTHVITLYIFTL
jgi:hypothetical protein